MNSNYETTINNPLSVGMPGLGGAGSNLDSTSSDTMKKFFSFVLEQYPADRYAFFISGHGNGWFFDNKEGRPENAPGDCSRAGFKDVNPVDMGSGDMCPVDIDPTDIATALQHNRPDVLVLDMCLMADVENLYQLRSSTEFLVANQTMIP